jgi:hypothetical protein
MNFNKIRSFCNKFRILLGISLITYAGYTYYIADFQPLFLLGIAPLIAGITKFCPLCMITKKCSIEDR